MDRARRVLLGLMFLLYACVSEKVPVAYGPVPIIFKSVSSGSLANTKCDSHTNLPMINVSEELLGYKDLVGDSTLKKVLFHERIHAREMLNHKPGGCLGFHKRYSRDRYFRFDAEARAYCGVLLIFTSEEDYPRKLKELKEFLWEKHGESMTLEEANKRADRSCRPDKK